MEIANGSHNKQGGGFMKKSMLIMSFYRSNRLSPSPAQYATTVVKQKPPSSSVQKVSPGGGFSCSDGYVHGATGVGGDEHVDNKASSYISQVKERVKREEMDIINNGSP